MNNIRNESAAMYEALQGIIDTDGSGVKNSQLIVTSSTPFSIDEDDDSDSDLLFAYKIQCLTASCKFSVLKEDGDDVDADLLDGGGSGYPIGTILNGKFSDIEIGTGSIALIWVARI